MLNKSKRLFRSTIIVIYLGQLEGTCALASGIRNNELPIIWNIAWHFEMPRI